MLTRTSASCTAQTSQFIYGILYCVWDTLELAWDVLVEIAAKLVHFLLAIFNLMFQVVIFLRDLCIETMQTFANVFQGIINVISTISCEDVEDFASACIVVLLWLGAIKVFLNMFGKMIAGLFSNKPVPTPTVCGRLPSIFFPSSRYQLPRHGIGNPEPIPSDFPSEKSDFVYDEELADKGFDSDGCLRKSRKRKKTLRRHNRSRILSSSSQDVDERPSD